jgi:hypothetical protein
LTVAVAVCAIPYGLQVVAYVRAHRLVSAISGEIDRSAFVSTYVWGGSDYDALETMRVAQRLRDETEPTDRLFVWGFEPGVYVYAERRPASRFLYDYPLMPRFDFVHRDYVAQLMGDLREHRPARIVVVRRDANDIEERASVDQLDEIPQLVALLEADYEPAWIEGDFFVYRRKGAAR